MRHFERESERCQLYTPELAVARTQLLDYFGDLQRAVPAENRLFRFERSMELGVGEGRLLSQLATQLGFAKDEASLGAFLSGQDSAMVDLFPELATFRDAADAAACAALCQAREECSAWESCPSMKMKLSSPSRSMVCR